MNANPSTHSPIKNKACPRLLRALALGHNSTWFEVSLGFLFFVASFFGNHIPLDFHWFIFLLDVKLFFYFLFINSNHEYVFTLQCWRLICDFSVMRQNEDDESDYFSILTIVTTNRGICLREIPYCVYILIIFLIIFIHLKNILIKLELEFSFVFKFF